MKIHRNIKDAKGMALNELNAINRKVMEVQAQPVTIEQDGPERNEETPEEEETATQKKARKKKKEADV